MTTMEEDLKTSGLVAADLNARVLDNSERAACNVPNSAQGYVIPFFNIQGGAAPHYRVKLFDFEPKYKQPKESANHVYFPKNWLSTALDDNIPYILLTEGEKKAALATKLGFPCVGFGGVDSWRNRVFTIPADSEMTSTDKTIKARIPSGSEAFEEKMSPLALGLQDLIDFAITHNKTIIIVYDTDNKYGTNHNVQRAAASLGFELRFRGIQFDKIRQILLPLHTDGSKVALDDYIMEAGAVAFQGLIAQCLAAKSAFPRHPNIRDYINKRLQNPRLSRKEMQQISIAVLSELDAGGMRLRSHETLETYYFDGKSHRLLKTSFSRPPQEMVDSPFGQYLYRKYGIGSADNRLVQWLGSQFTGEDPVDEVHPYRVFARPSDSKHRDKIFYQISDGQYVEVSRDELPNSQTPGLVIKPNGADNILFESEQVEPLDPVRLQNEYQKQYNANKGRPLPNWWADVLNNVRLVDKDRGRIITALLFYCSPWLLRWRGTQLPMEMTLGEAGSGKSTLQSLRLGIIDGKSKLRNAPRDMKDWAASVANTGGLHVTDNLQLMDRNMRQHMSDEICRIVTEPNPTIEMRKYFTTADLLQLPVRCVFGITAIKQPFLNQDVLQRGILIELDKSEASANGMLTYDSGWLDNQIDRYGGREAWIAHHLLVLHRFLEAVPVSWRNNYQAKHRLVNFEQCICLMGEVFGIKGGAEWIPQHLSGIADKAITEADWALEGIIAFSDSYRQMGQTKGILASMIADWAESDPDFTKCEEISNSRRLGKYLQTHKSMIGQLAGLVEDGTQNNRIRYKLVEKNHQKPS